MTKLHYFAGRGRAETTRWLLAACEIDFENIRIETPEALAALRATGKLPFDQLPLLEIDEHHISQSTALLRYLARRHDLYGDSDEEALWCDMLAGAVADFAEAAMLAAFQPGTDVAISAMQSRLDKFGPCFESRILEVGTGFSIGKRVTFADVVLGSALNDYLEVMGTCLAEYPLMEKLHAHITHLPGISRYLNSGERYPIPGDDYVISVARTLQRELPQHMPDANRFVVK